MRYEPAARNPTATGCQTGTRALATAVRRVYPELDTLGAIWGCFNRRKIAGSRSWSLHAEGRAFDVGVPTPLKPIGWALACDMVSSRVLFGVQRVMWDGHIWSVERINEWRPIVTSEKHLDHLHIEQHWAGATRPASMVGEYERALSAMRHAAPA